jgi:hypothetical protein
VKPTRENHEGRSRNLEFPQKVLNIGFIAALALAGTTLVVGAFYLFFFLVKTSASVETLMTAARESKLAPDDLKIAVSAQLVIAKVALLSCAILVGMAFGFLGFSLFLIGIRAEMDVEASKEGSQVKLARLSPGVLVIVCAAVMISVAATHPTPFTMGAGVEPGFADAAAPRTEPGSGPTRPQRAPGGLSVRDQVWSEGPHLEKPPAKPAEPKK